MSSTCRTSPSRRFCPRTSSIAEKPHPPSLSPRALAIAGWSAFAIAGAVFLGIAWNVTMRSALVALDGRVADWLHAHAGAGALTGFFFLVTNLHAPLAMGVATAAFAAVLARLREWYWIATLLAAVVGGAAANVILKAAYERVRPRFDDPLLVLTSFSFPSGHTAGAVLFYGVLAAFLVSRFYDARRRAACVAGAMALVCLVGFSRMYLGAHYLSDVLAAACSSMVWLVLCLAAGHALVRRKLRPEWLAGGLFIVIIVGTAVLVPQAWWASFEDVIERMHPAEALLVFCGVYAAALLLLLPTWIFPVAAGAVFGFFWGLAAALLALTASALAGFLLSRYVLHGWIARGAKRSKTFTAVDHTVSKKPFKVVTLLRLAPVIPCGLKSYFLGLTRVNLRDYLAASVVGVLPDLAVKVWLGAAGRDVLSHGGALHWALFAGGILALIALTFIVGTRVRRMLAL